MAYQKIISKCLDQEFPDVIQCTTCSTSCNIGSNCEWNKQVSTQKKIWKLTGASSSQYQENLTAMSVIDSLGPCIKHWRQDSDRQSPGHSTYYVPRSRTRDRPGGSGIISDGVDVKHNSYARYLVRKKGKTLIVKHSLNISALPVPIKGNKQYANGFVTKCNNFLI